MTSTEMYNITILWKSGQTTTHKTSGIDARVNSSNGGISSFKSDSISPRIVACDVTHIAAILEEIE